MNSCKLNNTQYSLGPLVSIIIPALNEEKNIDQCLNRVKKINCNSGFVEIIVVDNGSVDSTQIIARNLGVKVFEVKNITVAGLRNFGVAQCKGEYLAFLDADCIPSANWLIDSLDILESNPEVVVVGGIISFLERNSGSWVENYWVRYLNSKYYNEIEYVDTLASFCFVTRKKTFESVGGFNEVLTTCEDYDLGYRLSKLGRIVIDTRIKVVHLGNAKSLFKFGRRQFWQGRSNFQNLFAHKISFNELPSIIAPVLFVLACVGFFLSICLLDSLEIWIKIFFLALIVVLPAMAALRYKGPNKLRYFAGYWVIWWVYLLARGLGMLFSRMR